MITFTANRNLSKKELWCEIEWRRACFADTLKYLMDHVEEDDSIQGVLGMMRESFSELQALIEIVQPPFSELDNEPGKTSLPAKQA